MAVRGSGTDELDAIPEWVRNVDATKARNLLGRPRRNPGCRESIEQGIEATDDECRVGLGGWAEGVVDAEVEPNRSCGQPQATASGERGGLVDFGEFEEVNVERPRQILSSRRDCHLHVVEGEDDWYHVCSVPEDWVARTSEPPWFEAPLQRG